MFLFFTLVLAHHPPEEFITLSDLEIKTVGTLPTSPFYFFKEFGRAFRRSFTFGSVRKTEVELEILNEKAGELYQVQEDEPDNLEAVQGAIQNYRESHGRLKARLGRLRDTSENQEIDRLLENLSERMASHEFLFEDILRKFEDKEEIRDEIGILGEKFKDLAAAAAEKDVTEKFEKRLERARERAERRLR